MLTALATTSATILVLLWINKPGSAKTAAMPHQPECGNSTPAESNGDAQPMMQRGGTTARANAIADVQACEIAHVNAHGTSTIYNDRAEAQALTSLFAGASPPVTAVKGTTGHMIAGSGAVEAVVALASVAKCVVPPVSGLRTLDRIPGSRHLVGRRTRR